MLDRKLERAKGTCNPLVLPLRVTCCHEERCFDVVVLQIDERDNRREEIGEGTRQLDSQSVRNFFPILIFFFFFLPFGIRTASSIEAFLKLSAWILKIRSLMRCAFFRFFFLSIFFFFWKENFSRCEGIEK